jgi:outer membrane protein
MWMRVSRSWMAQVVALGLVMPGLAASADFKVGFVDQQKAILSSKEGQVAEKTLSDLAQKKQKELEPKQQELQRLGEELESQKFVLSKEVLEERRLDVMKRQRDLEREVQQAQEEIQIEQRRLVSPLAKRLGEVIQAIGKEKGFSLVLDQSSPGVLYSDGGLDITELVIKKLNEQ